MDVDDIYKRKGLEVGQSIQQIEKEQIARLKAKAKAGKLMLDE